MAKQKQQDWETAYKSLIRDLGGKDVVEELRVQQQQDAARKWLIGKGGNLSRELKAALQKTGFGKVLDGSKMTLSVSYENDEVFVKLRVHGNHSRHRGGYKKHFPIKYDGKVFENAMKLAEHLGYADEAAKCRYGVAQFLRRTKKIQFEKV